jgi:hypothetical protein
VIEANLNLIKLTPQKMCFYQAAGVANVDSTVTDLTGSRCKEINAAAWAWATQTAGKSTMARFNKLGEMYVMGDDVNSPIGITGKQLIYPPPPTHTHTHTRRSRMRCAPEQARLWLGGWVCGWVGLCVGVCGGGGGM